ncbi:hypothetical protein LI054_04625 [Clostridium perfringens]|nr:hypothetical protein [Clostridium perfringens]
MDFLKKKHSMTKSKEDMDKQVKLSPERACEILKNVFLDCDMNPPENCEKYFCHKDKHETI